MTASPSVSTASVHVVVARAQVAQVLQDRWRLVRTDWRIEYGESARIHRVERDVASVCFVGDIAEPQVVIEVGKSLDIRFTFAQLGVVEWSALGWRLHGRIEHRRRRRSPDAMRASDSAVQEPAFRHQEDRFTFFPETSKMGHQILERVEGQLFTATPDDLVEQCDVLTQARGRKAPFVEQLFRILVGHTRPSPPPLLADDPFDDVCLPAETDIAARHFRRHQRDEIVRSENPVQKRHQRLPHHRGAIELGVIGVEKDHEHAGARIGGGFTAAAQAVYLGARRRSARRPCDHVLEVLDLLRDSVFKNLEVGGRQVVDRLSVARGAYRRERSWRRNGTWVGPGESGPPAQQRRSVRPRK